MENEELIDKLKKLGKIKDASEAFKEFPPEEEWHKGDVDNYLFEDSEKYGEYNIGDIVFVNEYLYKNGKKGMKHLFVIVEKDNYAVPIEYFSMLISSHLDKLKFNSNKLLLKDNINNLKRDSIVKTDVIYKIKDKDILFKIGRVEKDVVEEYMKTLQGLF